MKAYTVATGEEPKSISKKSKLAIIAAVVSVAGLAVVTGLVIHYLAMNV